MSIDDVRLTTLQYLVPNLTAALGSAPTILNANFQEPDTTPYIITNVVEGDPHNAAVGGSLQRYMGFFQADVFIDQDVGTRQATTICDAISSILNNKSFSISSTEVLRYSVGSGKPIGPERGLYRYMVRMPYQRDIYT